MTTITREKSTIGRSVPIRVRGLRAWFRVTSVLAPAVAERHAATLFRTPRRRKAHHVARVPAAARRVLLADGRQQLVGWEWGIGPKPIVLLVHGWSGLASDMETIATALVGAGFRALAFDMPAHGHTPGVRTSLVEWIAALQAIDRWTGGLAGIVGHSFGGTATTLGLEAGLSAPRAVLISPASGPLLYVERIRRLIGLPEARVPGMVRRLVEQVGREIPYFDATRAATQLHQPALLLHDPADDEVSWEGIEALAAAWRGSELELREQLGHYRILRDPGVAARVAEYLGPGWGQSGVRVDAPKSLIFHAQSSGRRMSARPASPSLARGGSPRI